MRMIAVLTRTSVIVVTVTPGATVIYPDGDNGRGNDAGK